MGMNVAKYASRDPCSFISSKLDESMTQKVCMAAAAGDADMVAIITMGRLQASLLRCACFCCHAKKVYMMFSNGRINVRPSAILKVIPSEDKNLQDLLLLAPAVLK
jgi:ABC-type histidine transport system ATPase subunit